jgi:hypothetical protein
LTKKAKPLLSVPMAAIIQQHKNAIKNFYRVEIFPHQMHMLEISDDDIRT